MYRVECTDDDGNRRIIRTEDRDAADATAAYWEARDWAHDVRFEEVRDVS